MIDILRDNWLLLLLGQYPEGPLGGLAMTLLMAVLAIVLIVPASLGLTLALVSRRPWLRHGAERLAELVRGVPLLMFVFWIYFGLPLLIKRPVGGLWAMTAALVIYHGAYVAEILRAGIEAVPRGQREAAHALGLGYWSLMFSVILPQAVAVMLPSLILKISSIVKDTSVAYIISTPELSFAAAQLNGVLVMQPLQVFALLALAYFVLCGTLNALAGLAQRRLL